MTGIPRKYILKYNSASSSTSSGTFSTVSNGSAISSPIIATNTPPITDTTIEVCTAFCTVCLSSRPMAFAITTFAPSAMPINKFSIRPIIGLFAPTAATATVLSVCAKFPTIAISDALKSCSSIPVAAIGRAKTGSLFHILPLSISSFCFFNSFSIKSTFLFHINSYYIDYIPYFYNFQLLNGCI